MRKVRFVLYLLFIDYKTNEMNTNSMKKRKQLSSDASFGCEGDMMIYTLSLLGVVEAKFLASSCASSSSRLALSDGLPTLI